MPRKEVDFVRSTGTDYPSSIPQVRTCAVLVRQLYYYYYDRVSTIVTYYTCKSSLKKF